MQEIGDLTRQSSSMKCITKGKKIKSYTLFILKVPRNSPSLFQERWLAFWEKKQSYGVTSLETPPLMFSGLDLLRSLSPRDALRRERTDYTLKTPKIWTAVSTRVLPQICMVWSFMEHFSKSRQLVNRSLKFLSLPRTPYFTCLIQSLYILASFEVQCKVWWLTKDTSSIFSLRSSWFRWTMTCTI